MTEHHDNSLLETLNHIVEAIHHVLQVEVTIVDRSYQRLAATGLYANQIGHRVSSNSAFAKAMKTQASYIIDDPGEHPICHDCGEKGTCCETAEVCCPILLDGQAVGAIGLIAFDTVQKASLLGQRTYLLPFLENMAGLIASKMKELSQSKELEILTDAVDGPLFSIDAEGKILRTNAAARALLAEANAEQFQQVFSRKALERLLSGERHFQIKTQISGLMFDLKVQYIDASRQYVLVLKPVREMIKYVNRYFNQSATTEFQDIWGEDPALLQAKIFANQAAQSTASVLILGESGTGKELFARAIHNASPRKQQAFVAINCAAIPESLLESELFGYEEGAFTGSQRGGRIGKFEQAHKGTLFLDEIGDMPLHLQAKLLRVLQEGSIQKLGACKETPVDVRIITATNQDLEKMVAEGAFRRDLYYRIHVIPVEICPLRERRQDVPLLAMRFLKKSSSRLGKQIEGIAPEVIKRLEAYHWPGNVRELENVIEYMANMCSSTSLAMSDMPAKLIAPEVTITKPMGTAESLGIEGLSEALVGQTTLASLELALIRAALNRYGNDKSGIEQVCESLGISRATLYRKLKQDQSQFEI